MTTEPGIVPEHADPLIVAVGRLLEEAPLDKETRARLAGYRPRAVSSASDGLHGDRVELFERWRITTVLPATLWPDDWPRERTLVALERLYVAMLGPTFPPPNEQRAAA